MSAVIRQVQEALAFVRATCEHDWRAYDPWRDNRQQGRECRRCGAREQMPDDIIQTLHDHAALIRKMDAIANAERPTQTHEATAVLLERAAKVIALYRARKDIDDNPPYGSAWSREQARSFLRDALAYVRGDCDHDWRPTRFRWRECYKCGDRESLDQRG